MLSSFTPICPFFTHYLSTTLYGDSSVDIRSFPKIPPAALGDDPDLLRSLTEQITTFNSTIWKMKKDQGLSLKSSVNDVAIPEQLSQFADTLVKMHSIND